MIRKKAWLYLVCAAFAAFLMGMASDEANSTETSTAQAWVVGTYASNPGESKQAFVQRVGAVLLDWSNQTGTEACGNIAQRNDGGYVVTLTTEKSHINCLFSVAVPDGARLIGETIHNHPGTGVGEVKLDANDSTLAAALSDWDVQQCARRKACWVKTEPADFSGPDYDAGAGYLVTQGTLRYQHGRGTSELIYTFPKE